MKTSTYEYYTREKISNTNFKVFYKRELERKRKRHGRKECHEPTLDMGSLWGTSVDCTGLDISLPRTKTKF